MTINFTSSANERSTVEGSSQDYKVPEYIGRAVYPWNKTIHELDKTCILLRNLVQKNPENTDWIEKLIAAQQQLLEATKIASEQQWKSESDLRQEFCEDRRRGMIVQAFNASAEKNLEALKIIASIPVFHLE